MSNGDDHARVRTSDVGIFGLSRIIYALMAVGTVFAILVKLLIGQEVGKIQLDMERFRTEAATKYIQRGEVMTRAEEDLAKASRDREIRELMAANVEFKVRLEALDARVREVERSNDTHGWRK